MFLNKYMTHHILFHTQTTEKGVQILKDQNYRSSATFNPLYCLGHQSVLITVRIVVGEEPVQGRHCATASSAAYSFVPPVGSWEHVVARHAHSGGLLDHAEPQPTRREETGGWNSGIRMWNCFKPLQFLTIIRPANKIKSRKSIFVSFNKK